MIDRALLRLRADGGTPAPRVADVGTGSGCIAVTLAAEVPGLVVDAIDVSKGALEIARLNAERHGVADRIHFHQGDLLDPVSDAPPYDLICSNPPYILDSERSSLPVEVRDHEPALALFSGEDGLLFHKRLLGASHLLVSGGLLLMELPDGGDPALRAFVESLPGAPMIPLETEKDLAGIPRIFVAEKRRLP